LSSKLYRLHEFINPSDSHSLVVDVSGGLMFGVLPGLERFSERLSPLLSALDGVVTSPGQARKLSDRTRQDAALLLRSDWTNTLRSPEFVLPPEETNHIPILSPTDAADLGASAVVLYFLLGYEETIEAACLRRTVQFALEGTEISMPLIIDIQPTGSRVVLKSKAIELGVSYALEGGADGVVIPWPGHDSFKTIIRMAGEVPVWVKSAYPINESIEPTLILELGGIGLWLGETIFSHQEPGKLLKSLFAQAHRTMDILGEGEL
jgi:DhnA family fructose-bisphosphate aldolase class Ia